MRIFMIRAYKDEPRIRRVALAGELTYRDHWAFEPAVPKSEMWWDDAKRRIDRCAVVLWMMTIRSAASEPCAREASYALKESKLLFLWLMDPVALPAHAEHSNTHIIGSSDTSIEEGVQELHRRITQLAG